MIVELYGLPGSGKTTWAREKEKEEGWERVRLDNKLEIIYYNFIFLLHHPIRFWKLFFYIIVNSKMSFKLFYLKFMNNFLIVNAKYIKAKKYQNAIIDQGYFQNIISLFEKVVEEKTISNYLELSAMPDKLKIFKVDEPVRLSNLKNRSYKNREFMGENRLERWEKIAIENNNKLLNILPDDIEIEYVIN